MVAGPIYGVAAILFLVVFVPRSSSLFRLFRASENASSSPLVGSIDLSLAGQQGTHAVKVPEGDGHFDRPPITAEAVIATVAAAGCSCSGLFLDPVCRLRRRCALLLEADLDVRPPPVGKRFSSSSGGRRSLLFVLLLFLVVFSFFFSRGGVGRRFILVAVFFVFGVRRRGGGIGEVFILLVFFFFFLVVVVVIGAAPENLDAHRTAPIASARERSVSTTR
mmetsp:Transcript_54586/g.163100  ORF Transcript_54586/g.163100 Transcript_54586/m.163100 type:complete len:221 (-) Transcript_54586:241-903(-)